MNERTVDRLTIAAMVLAVVVTLLWIIPGCANAQAAAITKTWTAPGDDGYLGTASTYEMKYSTVKPDTLVKANYFAWWATATVLTGLPAPAPSGTIQSVALSRGGLGWPAGTYYFAMRAADEVQPNGLPNWSTLSNVSTTVVPVTSLPPDIVPPGRIINFR